MSAYPRAHTWPAPRPGIFHWKQEIVHDLNRESRHLDRLRFSPPSSPALILNTLNWDRGRVCFCSRRLPHENNQVRITLTVTHHLNVIISGWLHSSGCSTGGYCLPCSIPYTPWPYSYFIMCLSVTKEENGGSRLFTAAHLVDPAAVLSICSLVPSQMFDKKCFITPRSPQTEPSELHVD